MVSNAQLDNEKTNFMYQVEILQDALLELEEQLAESKRQFEEKSKVSSNKSSQYFYQLYGWRKHSMKGLDFRQQSLKHSFPKWILYS